MLDNTIGKVNELGRELIAGRKDFFCRFAVDRGDEFQFAFILVRILQSQLSFCANEIVMADIGRTKAACKDRQAFVRKTHDRAGHLLDFREAFLAVVGTQGGDLNWFVAKEVSRGIDAVNTDIEQRPAAECFLCTNVALLYLEAKQRSKVA